MSSIQLKELTKVYEMGTTQVVAVDHLNLEIPSGAMLAITGASGSGKSTLLNILGCLDLPSSGEYWWRGAEISQASEAERARIRNESIGFVFQSFHLIGRSTALENVMLPMLYAERADAKSQAEMLLEKVGLADRKNHLPTELSGGQQQRVAIARALANDPSMIIADEPTGALDSRTGEEMIEILLNLHAEGRTIILVTHEPAIAARCPSEVHLRDGKIDHQR